MKVITQTLRLELVAEPLRFTEIAPGMVKTEEFTLNRFEGDQERYDAVYDGRAPSRWWPRTSPRPCAGSPRCPSHVNIDELVVRPRAQAAQHKVHRVSDE